MLPNHVILASNSNPNYIQFWPVVARHWKQIHGMPFVTLFYVGKSEEAKLLFQVPEQGINVVHFEPLPGLPTSYQAQVLRLVAPTLYPKDVCVICDIDLFLLDNQFFRRYGLDKIPAEKNFVSLNRYDRFQHVSLSYQVALGETFLDVFKTNDLQAFVHSLPHSNYAWSTDEHFLTQALRQWKGGVWKKIFTPGLWNRCFATITRFRNCQWRREDIQKIQELEPFRPLQNHLPLIRNVLHYRNPQFQMPVDLGWKGILQEPNRHPQEKSGISPVTSAAAHVPCFTQLRKRR